MMNQFVMVGATGIKYKLRLVNGIWHVRPYPIGMYLPIDDIRVLQTYPRDDVIAIRKMVSDVERDLNDLNLCKY